MKRSGGTLYIGAIFESEGRVEGCRDGEIRHDCQSRSAVRECGAEGLELVTPAHRLMIYPGRSTSLS